MKQRWLGLVGNKCAIRSQKGVWDSETCKPSTLPCWRSKLGEFLLIQAPLLPVFSRQDIFPPVTSFVLGSSPSYSWRSIFNSLRVIRKGTRWRVGNGKQIHIWDDKWLPTPSTHKVISPPVSLPIYPMVSSLIDPATKWWRAEMIRAAFLPFEADAILKIPISHNLPDDKLIWMGNNWGEFTVKNAYHVAHGLVEAKEEV